MAAAPGPGQWLCALEDIPEGACTELRYGEDEDAFRVLLHRAGSDVKAYLNRCPHFSLPLNSRPGEFLILGGARIMCAYHCAVFRLLDGVCVGGPATGMALDAMSVEVRDGQVFLA